MEWLTIHEVGPRDGLQNETSVLTTDQKLSLIAGLVASGLRRIEATSFVSPKAMPQFGDAGAVMSRVVTAWPEVASTSLVINERGYERALNAGCRSVAVVVIASEALSRRNSRVGVEESLEVCRRLVRRARRDGVRIRVYLSAAWGCPYEGSIPVRRVSNLADRIAEPDPDEIAVADSVGCAHPGEVKHLLEILGERLGSDRLAVHLHDTQALGLANAAAAIFAGVRTIDASVGGLGGCPFAPGAAGNLATEDLVLMTQKMGYDTGVALPELWRTVAALDQMLGRRVGGRSRAWWEGCGSGEGADQYGADRSFPMG